MKLWYAARKTSLSLALAVIWGGACFMTVLTGNQVVETLGIMQEASHAREMVQMARGELVSQPLTKAQYEQTQAWVKAMHPEDTGLGVTAGDKGLTLRVTDLAKYGLWRMAVLNALNSQPGARWGAVRACVGSGCGGSFGYTIELSGSNQRFEVQSP